MLSARLQLPQADIHDHLSQRRSSYNIEYGRNRGGASGSASKVDLLKSALEINHKSSNSSVLSRSERTSNPSLHRFRADSAPKLNLGTSKTLIIPTAPVLEVIITRDQRMTVAHHLSNNFVTNPFASRFDDVMRCNCSISRRTN